MTTQTYATQVTAYFLGAIAAAEADGPMVNLIGGTLVVGDGGGIVPALSALIAANGVTHQVWSGQTINSVSVDPNNAAQLDVQVRVPATIGGVEIGPFAITEFAILDALGNCCIVGTTNLYKSTSGQGQISDLLWTAAVVNGVGQVTISPPSSSFLTLAQLIAFWNANLPTAAEPVTKTDTTSSQGATERVFSARLASQPVDAVSVGAGSGDANAIGVGRAASAAEFAAGVPTVGGFAWPWPTLQQIFAALAAIKAWVAGLFLPLVGGTLSGNLTIAASAAELVLDNTGAAGTQAEVRFEQAGAAWGVRVPYDPVDPNFQITSASAGIAVDIDYATGLLSLLGNPTAALGAAPKQYVDGAFLAAPAGYFQLSNGIIVQWATISFGSASSYLWHFPVTFPNAVAIVMGNDTAGSLGTSFLTVVGNASTATTSGVTMETGYQGGGGPGTYWTGGCLARVIAIGY